MQFRSLHLAVFFVLFQIWQTSSRIAIKPVLKKTSFCEECLFLVVAQSDAQNVHLICSSNSTFCPSSVANRVPWTTWTLFDREEDLKLAFDQKDLCVMTAEDVGTMFRLFNRLQKCHRANIIFAFPDRVESASLKTLFDATWKLGIIDVVVVAKDADSCLVHSYLPFRERGKCYDKTPILIDSWKRNSTCNTSNSVVYFADNKITNLHSCKLIVEYREVADDIYMGWYPLVAFLMRAMNATDEMHPHTHYGFPEIRSNTSNVLLGKFYVSPKQLHSFVIPSYTDRITTVLALPEQPILTIQWFRLFNELSDTVWYGIAVSFVISIFCLYIFMRDQKSFSYAVLFTFQSMLNIPCYIKFLTGPARVFFAHWLLFCLVLSATYLSTLLRKLTIPFTEESINSLADLTKSNLTIVLTGQFAEYAMLVMSYNYDYMQLSNKVKFVNQTYLDMVDRKRNDVAYIINRDDFDYLFFNMSYRVLSHEDFEITGTRLMLPRPSPYERLFRIAVLRIFEAGAFVCVERRALRRRLLARRGQRVDKNATPLSLKSLAAVFVLWLVGCGIAIWVFAVEYLTPKFRPLFKVKTK